MKQGFATDTVGLGRCRGPRFAGPDNIGPSEAVQTARLVGLRRSSLGTSLEHRHLPAVGGAVVPQDVDIAVVSADLEVATVRRQPAVEDVNDGHRALADPEAARRFLPAVARVTFDPDPKDVVGHGRTTLHGRRVPGTLELPCLMFAQDGDCVRA